MAIISGSSGGSSVSLSVSSSTPVQVPIGGINSVQSGLRAQADGVNMLAKSYNDIAGSFFAMSKHLENMGKRTSMSGKNTDDNAAKTDSAINRVGELKAQGVSDNDPSMEAAKGAAKNAFDFETLQSFWSFGGGMMM